MRTIYFFVFSIFNLQAMALTPDLLELPKHSSYFSSYYKKYYNWFNQGFFNWTNFLSQEEKALAMTSIKEADHWLEDSGPLKFSAFLIGIGAKKGSSELFYTLEMKLPSSQKVTKNYKSLKKETYKRVKWNTLDNSICFSTYKDWDCYNRSNRKFKYSVLTKSREIYRTDYFKYKIENDQFGESEFFYTNEFHFLALPVSLRSAAIKHGSDALLPLDKIEKSNSGTYIIYYP